MKSENEFNAWLSHELTTRRRQGLFHYKVCDRFTAGVNDFFIWRQGKTLALEVKFIKDWPAGKGKILGHTFTGPQQTFLESMALAGNAAYGAVAVGSEKLIYLIGHAKIPLEGNWTAAEFKGIGFPAYDWTDVAGVLDYCLG